MMPNQVPEDAPVFVISVAAQLSGMHPQTLRTYDRLGLVNPDRTPGGGRRYSARDIVLLREIARLSAEGVNLAGIKRIIELTHQTEVLTAQVQALVEELHALRAALAGEARYRDVQGRALVPMGNALMVWRPRPETR
jgi:MerR family transcriptional regulator/heat shock protein HspR